MSLDLPSEGETPWWVEALTPLTRELNRHWAPGWSWTTGGCFAFAENFCKVYGGKQWCVARLDKPSGEWDPDHAVVRLRGVFYDFTGIFDPEAYIARLAASDRKKGQGPHVRRMMRKNAPGLGWFEDEYLDDRQFAQLLGVLQTSVSIEQPARSVVGARF